MTVLRQVRTMIDVEQSPDFTPEQAQECENAVRATLGDVGTGRVVSSWWALPRIRSLEIGDLGTPWKPGSAIPPGTWRLMLDMQVIG